MNTSNLARLQRMLSAVFAIQVLAVPARAEEPATKPATGTFEELRKTYPKNGPMVWQTVRVQTEPAIGKIPAQYDFAMVTGYVAENSTFVIFLGLIPPDENGKSPTINDFKVYGRVWTCKVKSATEDELKKTVYSIKGPMVLDFFGVTKDELVWPAGREPVPAPAPADEKAKPPAEKKR